MQLPLEIVARGFDLAPSYRQEIEKRARKLDHFYGRIMRCRVTVEGPGRHHLQGFCSLRLDITVPGNEIVINQQSGENALEAIRESFGAAERRIEDHIRRSRRQVKVHIAPARARVFKLFPEKGYGFLQTPDGREIYFHQKSVVGIGFEQLKAGTVVRFSEEIGEKGPQASTVATLGRRPPARRRGRPGPAEAHSDRPSPEEPTEPRSRNAQSVPRLSRGPLASGPENEGPFARILVPLDGSLTSEAILPYLQRYFEGSELVVVRSPEIPGKSSGSDLSSIAEEVAKYVFLTLERLHREGWKAHARAASGPPAEAILKAARRTKPTLIAMTTHGRTGSLGQLMGSVAESVVRTSSVPVFVVRPFWLQGDGQAPAQPADAPKTILVPLSGSEASLGILSHVLVLAKRWDARVLLLHVNPDGASEQGPTAGDPLSQVQDELEASGIPVERLEARGDALARILEAAETLGVDLIAMSTHAGPPESRLDDHSLTAKVLRNASAPLYGVRGETEGPRSGVAPKTEKKRHVRRSREVRPARHRRLGAGRTRPGLVQPPGRRGQGPKRTPRNRAARLVRSAAAGRRAPPRKRPRRAAKLRGRH